jgi:hypothetical protein
MFNKSVAAIALASALTFTPSAFAIGRKAIPVESAQRGFRVAVTSQGVALVVPGEQITFIQLSHLSNIVCTTDNGNMCVQQGGGTGSANLLYLRRIPSITFPGQAPSPDGNTLLLLRTNGSACSNLCQFQLVPSSGASAYSVLEVGGTLPLVTAQAPSRRNSFSRRRDRLMAQSKRPPLVPQRTQSVAASPPVNVPLDEPIIKVELPDKVIASEPKPEPTAEPKPEPKPAATQTPVAEPTPPALPKPATQTPKAEAQPEKPKVTPKHKGKVQPIHKKQTSPISDAEVVSQALPKTPKPIPTNRHAQANALVRGLVVARRLKDKDINYSVASRVQDVVYRLRTGKDLERSAKRFGVPMTVIEKLLRLGSA